MHSFSVKRSVHSGNHTFGFITLREQTVTNLILKYPTVTNLILFPFQVSLTMVKNIICICNITYEHTA